MAADLTPEDAARAAVSELAGILLTDQSPEATLGSVASAAKRAIPACRAASVTLIERGRPRTPVSTDASALEVDRAQYESDEGPCLHAVRQDQIVPVPSMRDEQRWHSFRQAALEQGFESSLSLPLRVGQDVLGALNLYGGSPGGFDAAQSLGRVFARHAAVVLANAKALHQAADLAQNLAIALERRDVIGQAKGIIMATRKCSADAAFDVLRRTSQQTNRKLHDIAEEVVRRRADPGEAT